MKIIKDTRFEKEKEREIQNQKIRNEIKKYLSELKNELKNTKNLKLSIQTDMYEDYILLMKTTWWGEKKSLMKVHFFYGPFCDSIEIIFRPMLRTEAEELGKRIKSLGTIEVTGIETEDGEKLEHALEGM